MKQATKIKEKKVVEGAPPGGPCWWDGVGVANAYEAKEKHFEVKARVKAQTNFFAKHEAAKSMTENSGVVVHPEHIKVWLSADQTEPVVEPAPRKKANGARRKNGK